MIRGVLFDMDGVLLDSERLGRAYIDEACRENGYAPMDDALYLRLLGATSEACRAMLLEELGGAFPYDRIFGRYRERMHAAAVSGAMPLKDGLAECMAGLKARGLRIALATSTSRASVETYLAHIPEMRQVFDAMVCGGEAGRSKPAPDIYLEAARRIGAECAQCVGVEDSRAGLYSLRAAGAVSVMIPDLLPYDASLAGVVDYRLQSLRQLCGLIDRLNLGARARG